MRQLTSLDAQFLALENSRQTGHVGSLAMLDAVDRAGRRVRLRAGHAADLRARAAAAAAALAAGRGPARARPSRTGSRRPRSTSATTCARWRWRRRAPTQQLADQVARIMSRPLDRARPLWELYVIEGHESGLVCGADEDPPRGHRRPLRRRDHGAAAGPHARGPRGAAAPRTTTSPTRRRPRLQMLGARDARPAPLPGADAARAAEGDPEPRGHAVRRSSPAWARCRSVAGMLRRDGVERPGPDRAQDDLQRAHLAAPALRLRPAAARASSRRPRTSTARPSTTSSSASARARCGAG